MFWLVELILSSYGICTHKMDYGTVSLLFFSLSLFLSFLLSCSFVCSSTFVGQDNKHKPSCCFDSNSKFLISGGASGELVCGYFFRCPMFCILISITKSWIFFNSRFGSCGLTLAVTMPFLLHLNLDLYQQKLSKYTTFQFLQFVFVKMASYHYNNNNNNKNTTHTNNNTLWNILIFFGFTNSFSSLSNRYTFSVCRYKWNSLCLWRFLTPLWNCFCFLCLIVVFDQHFINTSINRSCILMYAFCVFVQFHPF